MASSHLKVVAMTATAPIIWGSTYLVTQTLLPADTPLTAATIRALPAGMLILLWTRQTLSGGWWVKAMVLGTLNIGLFFTCLFAAAYRIPGSMAALLLASQSVWVLLLSHWWLGTGFSMTAAMQCGLGMVGVVLLLNPGQGGLDMTGVGIALIGAVSMAAGIVLSKRWQRPPDVSQLSLTGWQLIFGGLLLLPLAAWSEGIPTNLELQHLLGYGYLILPGGVLGYGLWFAGIQRLPAFSASLLGIFSPLTATVLGFVWMGESFGPLQWLGTFCIASALTFPLWVSLKRRSAQPSRHELTP